MTFLQDDILIDKLCFSFYQNNTNLYSHIKKYYCHILQNHNPHFAKNYAHHVLEFNPSYNRRVGHNLEAMPEAYLRKLIFYQFGINPKCSRQSLKQLLTSPTHNSIRLTRLHLTRDFLCTHSYGDYYSAIKKIQPRFLKQSIISSKGAQSLYFRRGKKDKSFSDSTKIIFYNKKKELISSGHVSNLSSVQFLSGANVPLSGVSGFYDLSMQDIMRIEIAFNSARNQHMLSFNAFIRLLYSQRLYKFLERRYKKVLMHYLFYNSSNTKCSNKKAILREVAAQQGIDMSIFKTLFLTEGVSPKRIRTISQFVSDISDPYISEIVQSLP